MPHFAQQILKIKTLIGMVHTHALPGTPKNMLKPTEIINHAVKEAIKLKDAGFGAILIENMHDTPYLNRKAGAEITSLLSIICYEIKNTTQLPIGLQILAGANNEAIAVAHAANIDFIRAEGFVFGHMADEGLMNSCAGDLLRFRKQIEAETISIFTDIKKKHSSHTITSDISIEETAEAADFFLSDGIIITGCSTGKQASIEDIQNVKNSTKLPILVGSGLSSENIEQYIPFAHAFIVGSSIKKDGKWFNDIKYEKASKLVSTFNRLIKS